MKKPRRLGKQIRPYGYILPAVCFLSLFFYYPFVKNTVLSLFSVNKYRQVNQFVGLQNYAKVFADEKFLLALRNTLIFVVATVPATIAIALGLALLARKRRRLSPIYEAMFSLSMATSASVIAMIAKLAFDPSMGVVNKVLGMNVHWLSDRRTALLSVILLQIWGNIGYNFIFLLAALRGIPEDIMESARLDGATGTKLLTRVMLPLVSPTLLFLIVSGLACAMTSTTFILILTDGGPSGVSQTIVTYVYSKAVKSSNYSVAFAATTVGFFLTSILLYISFRLDNKKVSYD